MKTKACPNDKKVSETLYTSADYVVEYDSYGTRVFKTLKPNHSIGTTIVRVLQCEKCQTERARPEIQQRLKDAQEIESVSTEADWVRTNNKLAKTLGLSVQLSVSCTKCGAVVRKNSQSSRNVDERGPLCEKCYTAYRTEYKRNYMRDFMRQKRESTHVD